MKYVKYVMLCAIQPAALLSVALLHGCFSCFLICINDTKLCKASHIYKFFTEIGKKGKNKLRTF